MKDNILLLVAGLLIAFCSWTFWHFLGEDAFDVLTTVLLLAIAADNIRLRRKLRSEQERQDVVGRMR